MSRGELALAFLSGGLGFAVADFVDRYMATYNPSTPAVAGAAAPTYFTGGTNGTLANTLNIATAPSLLRIGVGIGVTAVPAIGAYLVKNSMGRAALQGMMLGAGIKLFSTLWNAYVMGNLLKPANSTQATMQASLGARLYPAEIVAAQNIAGTSSAGGGLTTPTGLNAPPRGLPARQPQQRFVQPQRQPQRQGVGDVGPFAVAQAAAVCAAGTVADSLTGQCVAPCWDGSTPAGGACPPQPTSGCGPSQVIDSVTGGCANPCPDGSAPANGVCNGGTIPVGSNYPAPQPSGNPPNGGWTKVSIPNPGGDCDNGCGLADKQGPLPEYLGFLGND